MHVHTHTYIHTTQAYIHNVHAYIQRVYTYTHTYIHTYIHTYMHAYIQWAIEGGNREVVEYVAKHQYSADTVSLMQESILV